jgi:hypothetical protein
MAVRWSKGTRDPRPGREDGTLARMRGPIGDLAHRLAVARGDEPADAVLAGGRVLSVFTGELLDADVAMAGEHVAGVGRYDGHRTVDAAGLILLPGFIDGHMHIESTKLPPDEFARAALPWERRRPSWIPTRSPTCSGSKASAHCWRRRAGSPWTSS